MNLISLDLEYNNKKQILSSGIVFSNLFNIYKVEEKFFNNKSDNITYNIHGLNNQFLKENGTNRENSIEESIKNSDYVIGFDLQHDFKVLKLNTSKLYSSSKVIDIKLILDVFNIKISLSNLLKKTNIIKDFKNLFPIHTSIMDSFLSFVFLEYLVNLIKRNTNFNTIEILKDLSEISNHKYFNQYWIYEPIVDKYFFLNNVFKELNSIDTEEDNEDFIPKVLFLKDNVEIYDDNFYIIGKYKKKDFSLKEFEELKINTKKDISIGYRDIIK